MSGLLTLEKAGLYCSAGDFYIDPSRSVQNAVVTHAHADHASRGHKHYLAETRNQNILKHRLGKKINLQLLPAGEQLNINGVRISFHPSAHIWGAHQVRIEQNGEVWVVSGDYKVENDGFSGEFEPVICHTYITECTFGLPIYQWQPQGVIYNEITDWVRQNSDQVCVIRAYSLGKAQRLIFNLADDLNIYVDENIWHTNEAIRGDGAHLPSVNRLSECRNLVELGGSLVLMSSLTDLVTRLPEGMRYQVADASGWMQVPRMRRGRGGGRGFVLSDHADWPGLNWSVEASCAQRVYATHGYDDDFSQWLNSRGIDSCQLSSLQRS